MARFTEDELCIIYRLLTKEIEFRERENKEIGMELYKTSPLDYLREKVRKM
jgi:hypothetical protein